MHELSVVASLFEIMEEKAQEKGSKKIISVKLQVGKLSGVIPELLFTAFDVFKKDTIADEAELEIAEIPYTIQCKACGETMTRDDFVFTCIHCGSQDLITLTGKELVLEKMELEL